MHAASSSIVNPPSIVSQVRVRPSAVPAKLTSTAPPSGQPLTQSPSQTFNVPTSSTPNHNIQTMLASAATLQTSISSSPIPPTRPSRLRGLSYLRSYTHDRLSRAEAPPLTRSTSSPNTSTLSSPSVVRQPERPVEVERRSDTPDTPTMARNRATTTSTPTPAAVPVTPSSSKAEQHPTIRLIPHIEARSPRPSLHFTAIAKTLRSSTGIIRVGRYTEREQSTPNDEILPIGFKSKVVSRRHCEFWCTNGQWYVKDVKSSSGTFLNHVRLSSPGVESRPYPVNDGDVVQLGIDFKGGEEVIFRCVKIRIECNRGWQKGLNNFNTSTHRQLLNTVSGKGKRDSDTASVSNHECSICLNPVTPCQCLFVAPCSHVWHYKCVRGLVHSSNWPNFICPNCRFVADLEADVEPPEEDVYEELESVHGDEIGNGDIEHSGQSSSDEAIAGAGGSDLASTTPESHAAEFTVLTPSSTRSIPMPIRSKHQSPANDLLSVGQTTPGSTAAFAMAAGIVPDSLMTPRNDVGPFILDGSAGRVERALHGVEVHGIVTQAIDEHDRR